jgi:hypothetical protein
MCSHAFEGCCSAWIKTICPCNSTAADVARTRSYHPPLIFAFVLAVAPRSSSLPPTPAEQHPPPTDLNKKAVLVTTDDTLATGFDTSVFLLKESEVVLTVLSATLSPSLRSKSQSPHLIEVPYPSLETPPHPYGPPSRFPTGDGEQRHGIRTRRAYFKECPFSRQ